MSTVTNLDDYRRPAGPFLIPAHLVRRSDAPRWNGRTYVPENLRDSSRGFPGRRTPIN